MTTHSRLTLAALLLPLASTACSITTTDPTGSGGSTSSATAATTAATTTSVGSTTTTTGAGGDCVGVFPAGACATCGEASCCAQGKACDITQGCIGCVYSSDLSCTADNKAVVDALLACLHTSCEAACYPPPPAPIDVTCIVPAPSPSLGACVTLGGVVECNPITNEGCDSAKGEACDFKGAGYHCYGGPNDAALCGACGPISGGGHCKGGSTCLPSPDGKCGKFCCADSDCGAGKCEKKDGLPSNVGYCVGGNP
jgi:hypothetical protein